MEEKNTISIVRHRARSALAEYALLNYGMKVVLGLVIALVFLTAVQCSIKEPASPTWTTNLTIPLVSRIYYMEEIITKIDQENLIIDSTLGISAETGEEFWITEPLFLYNEEMDPIGMNSDDFSISNISHSASETVGKIKILPGNLDPDTIYISESIDPDTLQKLQDLFNLGQPLDLGAQNFGDTINLPLLSGFQSATIETGTLSISLTNKFGPKLEVITVEVYDIGRSATVSTQSVAGGIENDFIATLAFNLANKTISNQLQFRATCQTAAGIYDLNGYLAMAAGFDDSLTVTTAVADISRIPMSISETQVLSGSNVIDSAILATGSIKLTIRNQTSVEIDTIFITMPDFYNTDGNPLSINTVFPAIGDIDTTINLVGYSIKPNGYTAPQNININVETAVKAAQMVSIDQYDSLSVSTNISNLSFSSITGTIAETEGGTINEDMELELPEGFDKIQLVSAVLTLKIDNGFDIPGSVDLTISGDNGKTLPLSGNILADDSTTLTISESTLTNFLNPIPSNITVTGSASFGDGVSSGTITPGDSIFSTIQIRSPLDIKIASNSSFEVDSSEVEINQDNIGDIIDNFTSATLYYIVENHLPLGAEVELYMDGNPAHLTAEDDNISRTISISPGEVDSTGTVNICVVTEQQFSLNSDEIQSLLGNDTLYIAQSINLLSADTTIAVTLSSQDYYKVTSYIEVEYNFDGEF